MLNYTFCLLSAFFFLFAFSCSNKEDINVPKKENQGQFTDATGNLPGGLQKVERLVCLFEPAVDLVYMLHAEELLVGVTGDIYTDKEVSPFYSALDDRIKQKSLATPSIKNGLNAESILSLSPDLIVISSNETSMIQTFRSLGLNVYAVAGNTHADIVKEVKDLSMLLGKTERGQELLHFFEKGLDELALTNSLSPTKARVYFSWAYGRIFSTTGKSGMMNTCLEFAGVENVCQSPVDQPNINPETLLIWNPDMIIIWNDEPNLFFQRPELKPITALQKNQIFRLSPMFVYNPHNIKSLCTAKQINIWAYGDKESRNNSEIEAILRVYYGEKRFNKIKSLL